MDSGATIRDGCSGDEAAVFALWDRAYDDGGGHRQPDDVSRILAGGTGARLLVAEVGTRVAGALVAGYDGWRGTMYGLAVDPDYRRRGIAGALVSEAEAWLESIGCHRITALVVKDHPWATGFWESAGYALDDFMGRYSRNLGGP